MTVDTLAQPIAPSSPGAVRETRSTCCYCGVGCGVVIETRRDANGRDTIVGVRGDPTIRRTSDACARKAARCI